MCIKGEWSGYFGAYLTFQAFLNVKQPEQAAQKIRLWQKLHGHLFSCLSSGDRQKTQDNNQGRKKRLVYHGEQ